MHCPNCAAEIEGPYEFPLTCPGCGESITHDDMYTTYYCPRCRVTYALPWDYTDIVHDICGQKGVPVGEMEPSQPDDKEYLLPCDVVDYIIELQDALGKINMPVPEHAFGMAVVEDGEGVQDAGTFKEKVLVLIMERMDLVGEEDNAFAILHCLHEDIDVMEVVEAPTTPPKYAGSDCPGCGKKGTVFRCPRRKMGGHWDYGEEVVCYVCINCTLSDVDGPGCSPGLGKGMHDDNGYWGATPEMSQDLYEIIMNLYNERTNLDMIKKGLGFPTREAQGVLEEYNRHIGELIQARRKDRDELNAILQKMTGSGEYPPSGFPTPGPRRPPGGPAPSPLPTHRPPRGPPPAAAGEGKPPENKAQE